MGKLFSLLKDIMNYKEDEYEQKELTQVSDIKINFINKKRERSDENPYDSKDNDKNKKFKYEMEKRIENLENNFEQYKKDNNVQQSKLFEMIVKSNNNLYINNNKVNNSINNNIIKNNFSYQIINPDLKNKYINIINDRKSKEFNLTLRNNGTQNWPQEKTKLVIDKKLSNLKIKNDEINLGALEVGKENEFKVNLEFDEKLAFKQYHLALDFVVDNKVYGKKIEINFKVVDNGQIKQFRNVYGFDKKSVSDTIIGNKLVENNNNFPYAYNNLFPE